MFYRRKILLALVESFGGKLTKTDCQKLMLLFCARRGKNYYDFFPHTYGNFSFILAQDKDRLVDLGLLASYNEFKLTGKHAYQEQIHEDDLCTLVSLIEEVGTLRGEGLIQKVYLAYPHYTSRSQIAKVLLSEEQQELISCSWNQDLSPQFFTLGYEGLSIDAYLDLLISSNVAALIDVRKNPISMKFGFSKTRLIEYTKSAGISYIHIPALGIPSNMRKNLDNQTAYQELFTYYSVHILPTQLDAIEYLKNTAYTYKRVAITCFEADYHYCHRQKVAEYLERDSAFTLPVTHLGKECVHSVTKVQR